MKTILEIYRSITKPKFMKRMIKFLKMKKKIKIFKSILKH